MTPRAKVLSTVLAATGLAALAIWTVRSTTAGIARGTPPSPPTVVAAHDVPTPALEEKSTQDVAASSSTIADSDGARTEAPAAPANPDTSPLLTPNAAYSRYLAATNPAIFFGLASSTGSPDDLFYASEAARLCAEWVMPPRRSQDIPIGLLELRSASYGPWKKFALDEVERCKGFIGMDDELSAIAAIMRREAAEAGSLPALAADLVNLRRQDAQAARAAAIRVLESRDAAAVANLWPYLEAEGVPARMGDPSPNLRGSPEWLTDAWYAMACDNGLDCGPTSPLMKSLCRHAYFFSCKGATYADFLTKKNGTPNGVALTTNERRYVDILRKREWKRLGLE